MQLRLLSRSGLGAWPRRSAAPVEDQASVLRRLARRRPTQRARIIAIISGKGGVGKTNVAVNLGIALAGRAKKVTLIDMDVGLANADLLLGVQPRYDLSHVMAGALSMRDVAVKTSVGLRFVAGASVQKSATGLATLDANHLERPLRSMGGDFVLLDCAAGLGNHMVRCANLADEILLVCTPEPTSITDAYAALKTLYREGCVNIVRLLVNMVESRIEAKQVSEKIQSAAQKFLNFTVADAGYILHDTHVELAVRQRRPFTVCFPKSSASVCVAAVAQRLARGAIGQRRTMRDRVASLLG